MFSTYQGWVNYTYNMYDLHEKELSFSVIGQTGLTLVEVQDLVVRTYPDKLALVQCLKFEYTEKPWVGLQNPPDQLEELT